MKNEIVLYRPNELAEHIEVRIDDDTVWLNQAQIADLFGTRRQAITKHLKNIFESGELEEEVVCSILELTTIHGAIADKTQTKMVKYYNLDAILSVGYRVNSINATIFRKWANRVLREYLLRGYVVNSRITTIEDDVRELKHKVNEIDLQINTHQIPTQGVFYKGDVFDAYDFTSKLIRSAKKSIVLIDNFIDERTITQLTKKTKNVRVIILTKDITPEITLDVQKANAQYGNFEVKHFTGCHDRFLIIDETEIYHIGASLKDLGRRLFAFTKMNKSSVDGIMKTISRFI